MPLWARALSAGVHSSVHCVSIMPWAYRLHMFLKLPNTFPAPAFSSTVLCICNTLRFICHILHFSPGSPQPVKWIIKYIYIKAYSLGCKSFMDFHKCLMFCVQHHTVIQNGFTALKNMPCTALIQISPLPNPWQLLPYFLSPYFCCFQKIMSWNHMVCSLFRLALLQVAFQSHLCLLLGSSSFILLPGCTSLFIRSPIEGPLPGLDDYE